MQRHGFDPPLRRIFPVEGIVALELTWVHELHTPPPPHPPHLRMRVINRGLVCAHVHSIARTRTDCPRQVIAGNKNTPSMHHPPRRNVTTSVAGFKNGHIGKNLTQNGEPQRSSWGMQKKKKKQADTKAIINSLSVVFSLEKEKRSPKACAQKFRW